MNHLLRHGIMALLMVSPLGMTPARAEQPNLVLVVVVDQLRGDMPSRYPDRLGRAGFRYFLDNGTVFSNAQFCHVTTTTSAGHATLATGGNPPQHGIAANEWFDSTTRKSVYSTEDVRYPLIGDPPGSKKGRSPNNLESSTFGDELVLSTAGNSRVFSVSIKDRAAILLGGRRGKAWWYSKTSGQFVTSTYYYETYPAWVKDWNLKGYADQFRTETWDLLLNPDSYVFKNQDDQWFEIDYNGLGKTFPHRLADTDQANFHSALRYTPMGDQLTLRFVKELVAAEKIGQTGHTDVLAVSFSVTDYIGHAFGPDSLEAEDNLLRLDRTVQELLEFIDQKIGLGKTLAVLASDHGVGPAPEYMAEHGFKAERLEPSQFMEEANRALGKTFNTDRSLVLDFWSPGLYLDLEAIAALGLDVAQVERELASVMMAIPGFTLALAKTDIMAGQIPDTLQARRVACGLHPERSGNVIVVQDPFWFLSREPHEDAAMHGSPWNYDSHVPLMIAGPGIGQGKVDTPVSPHDLAPTISNYLGISPPSGSTGTPLPYIKNPN